MSIHWALTIPVPLILSVYLSHSSSLSLSLSLSFLPHSLFRTHIPLFLVHSVCRKRWSMNRSQAQPSLATRHGRMFLRQSSSLSPSMKRFYPHRDEPFLVLANLSRMRFVFMILWGRWCLHCIHVHVVSCSLRQRHRSSPMLSREKDLILRVSRLWWLHHVMSSLSCVECCANYYM